MTPERWRHIQTLFHHALDRPPEQRLAFLKEVGAEDAEARTQVEALLAADAARDAFPMLEASPGQLASLLPAREPAPLETRPLGPYRLVRALGHGGMGAVYLAERADGQFSKQVALKLVKRGMDTDEILRRFRYERQILAALEHPHIARLYDGGVSDDGRPYLAMEYVDGQVIDAYCDDKKRGVEERLALFEQVCEAVQYAHQNLVVHRDLKPSNILVTETGMVKLLDFGIAKLLGAEEPGWSVPVTRTGVRVMTPEYASPEQVRGAMITTASDVYALGVILYELLTGHRPYGVSTTSAQEAEQAILEQEPGRPSSAVTKTSVRRHRDGTEVTLTPETISDARATTTRQLQKQLKGDLDTILLKALRKEPERRYQSAEQFLEDIKRYRSARPVTARSDTVGYRARTFIRRRRVGVALSLAMLVLSASIGIVYTARVTAARNRAQAEADKAEQVANFLTGLFSLPDPYGANSKDMTAQEILDRGADQIDQTLADQPEVRATMMAIIGETYHNMKLYDRAWPLLEEALRIRQRVHDVPHPDLVESLIALAAYTYTNGDYAGADSLYREAAQLQRRLAPDDDPRLAHILTQRATISHILGALDAAEPFYQRALTIYRRQYGDTHEQVAQITLHLGTLAHQRGAFDEAEARFRRVLAIRQAVLRPDHPNIGLTLYYLGLVLYSQQRYVEAETVARDALALRRQVLGTLSAEVAADLQLLGLILHAQQRYAEAARLYGESLDIRQAALGEHHPAVGFSKQSLAQLSLDQGDAETALQLGREAITVFENALPEEHYVVAKARAFAGQCLVQLKRYREAEPLVLAGLAAARTAPQAEAPELEQVLEDLIAVYNALGQPDNVAEYRALLAQTNP